MTTEDFETPFALLSNEQWRKRLTSAEYHILREAGTEAPFTGEYTDEFSPGIYSCRACGLELFSSATKFHSHCGWPSFFASEGEERIRFYSDDSIPGRPRVEVRCARCDSHLGHVFDQEGYATPTDRRFCINSLSLRFSPSEEK